MSAGAKTLAKPTPKPPITRQTIRLVRLCAKAEPMALARNNTAATTMLWRRPILSDNQPAARAPMAEPIKADATARPKSPDDT